MFPCGSHSAPATEGLWGGEHKSLSLFICEAHLRWSVGADGPQPGEMGINKTEFALRGLWGVGWSPGVRLSSGIQWMQSFCTKVWLRLGAKFNLSSFLTLRPSFG